jgi:hypothetical protein
LPASCILNCLTGQVKGAADDTSAENRKSLPLRAVNRGDDPLPPSVRCRVPRVIGANSGTTLDRYSHQLDQRSRMPLRGSIRRRS